MAERQEGIPILKNVLWGVRWGIYGGLFFTAIAAIPALLRSFFPEMGDARIPPFSILVTIYLAGGVAAGAIVGAVRPLMRWWIARRLIGIMAAVPISFGFEIALNGYEGLSGKVESVLWFAVIWGFGMSFAAEEDPLAPFRRRKRRY